MFHVQAAPKAQREEAGRLWALRSTDCRQEPLEVRKRSLQILINLLVCALVYLWSHSHVLCCRVNPSKLIFERRAWKHLPEYQGCVRKRPPCPCWEHQSYTTSSGEREQRTVFDLVEDTFVARF